MEVKFRFIFPFIWAWPTHNALEITGDRVRVKPTRVKGKR